MRQFLCALLPCLAFGLAGCGNKSSDIVVGYDYSSSDFFKSVIVPAPLKGGQSKFELVVGGKTFPLEAGKRFFFKEEFPEGVKAFTIRGINPSEQLEAGNLNAFGATMTFANEGFTPPVKMIPIRHKSSSLLSGLVIGSLVVLAVGGLCVAGFLWWKKQNAA